MGTMGVIRAGVLATICACSYAPQPNAPEPDGPTPDTAIDTPPNANCFGQLGTVCLGALPSGPYTLGGPTEVNSDIAAFCESATADSNVMGCVVSGTSVTIDAELIGKGVLPLIIIATEGEIVVDDLIDVSSRRMPPRRGAGANPLGLCNSVAPTGGHGGAGGSSVGLGGGGGGGLGGTAAMTNTAGEPTGLRGACNGTPGGTQIGQPAGTGGGAVWLISKVGIRINGRINASGAGGEGGAGDAGGGVHGGAGGGAGGMIVLDAPSVMIATSGVVAALGGGGGGGNNGGTKGGDGNEADLDLPLVGPLGGNGAVGLGGTGGTTANGTDGSGSSQSGCGGGGGAGFIRSFVTVINGGIAVPAITEGPP